MCIAFWTLNHPEYALILCNNRDEYFDRATDPVHWHNFGQTVPNLAEPTVLSGIDAVAKGTWLGINKSGNIALLTNITEPGCNVSSSRGHLCSSFLLHSRYGSEVKLNDYVEELTTTETSYSGFNLLLLSPSEKGESQHLQYEFTLLSNGGACGPIRPYNLSSDSSCFGLSNNTPNGVDPFTGEQKDVEWAKVGQGRQILDDILERNNDETGLIEELFLLLRTTQRPPPTCREDFQCNIMINSVDLAEVRRGTSFNATKEEKDEVHQPNANIEESRKQATLPSRYYATRLATVILVRRNGEVVFVERDVWYRDSDSVPKLRETGETRYDRKYEFQIKRRDS